MKKIFVSILLTIFIIPFCFSQEEQEPDDENPTQTVSGRITDKDSGTPLWGASVVLVDSNQVVGCISDSSGYYKLPDVPVGRQIFKINYLGYEEVLMQNVLITSGKDVFLNIQMKEAFSSIGEVEIVARINIDKAMNTMATISARTFSVEETKRFAGGFNDPSRMAQSFAGVSATSNSNNEIIVRGNSPRGLLWRIEGVEVPNPNHFQEDEGASGGGVCILSSNVIAKSDFFTSAFPAEYGNAFSGVFDLNLRKGSDEYFQSSINASVIGTEVSLEGPVSKKQKSSYLINYRYSTFALLDKVGIKVSDENVTPSFQDLTCNFSFPSNSLGHTTAFAILGKSSSGIKAVKDSLLLTQKENRYEEYNNGNVWITGLTNKFSFSDKKTYLKTIVSLMGSNNEFINDTMDYNFNDHNIYNENIGYTTLRATTLLNHKLNSKNTFRTGIIYSRQYYNLFSSGLDFESNTNRSILDNKGVTNVLQGYFGWKYRVTDKIDINSGLHYLNFMLNKKQSLEPRMGIEWKIDGRQSISTGAGLHSRLEPVSLYLMKISHNDTITQANKNINIAKTIQCVFGYDLSITEDLHFKAEVYYQHLFDIPVEDSINSQFSTLNLSQGFVMVPLANDGVGKNYGIDITFEKYFTKTYYFLITGSLFDSKYTPADGIEYNSAYNGNYMFNIVLGKEWAVGRKNNALLGINSRLLYKGGLRYQPVDLEQSRLAGKAIYVSSENFTKRLNDYYNVDFGINFKRNRAKYSWTVALDIQNITNHKNILRMKYNTYTGNIQYDYDLLLLPVLSFNIDF